MKYSIVFAAMLAAAVAGCGKQPTASAPVPAAETKQQAGDASKAESPKTGASVATPADGQPSAVAAAPAPENKPAEGAGTVPAGGEAKAAEGAAAQPAKKETK